MSGVATNDPGSFVRRHLDVSYTLGSGSFADGVSDTVTLSGLRMSAAIVKQGGVSQGALDLRIYGLTQSMMNRLSLLGGTPQAVSANNSVTLLAYSSGSTGLSAKAVAYKGTISNAWPNYAGSPDVSFDITAFGALAQTQMAIPPTSVKGTGDVATIMAGLAKQMGVSFENNGVNVKLSNPYLKRDAYSQAEHLAYAAGINMALDDGVLAIWPVTGSRKGTVPLISPTTGLVSYPVKNQIGVTVRTLYNPAFTLGATVQIQSSLTPACGTWQINTLSHNLESEVPDGQWFSTLACVTPGYL